jgi:MFS superfamily sulfate permease-like transporter
MPGTNRFSDRERNPENELIEGVVIVRVEAGLVYFNIEYVHDSILEFVNQSSSKVKLVVCDLSASPRVDLQSAHTLAVLAEELAARGIRLQVVEARSSVRDRLRAEGLDEKLGGIDRFRTVAQTVEEFENEVKNPAHGNGLIHSSPFYKRIS